MTGLNRAGRHISRVSRLAIASVAVASQATGAPPSVRPAYIPIEHQTFDVPAGIQPSWPTFTPDGRDILFIDSAGGGAWLMGSDGTGLTCITCTLADRPKMKPGFLYVLPGGKRLLLTAGLAAPSDAPDKPNAWVLECAGGLRNCQDHRFVPVDMSAARGPIPTLQRRTWHLSPDGKHIGWMEVRADATVMIVARLERRQTNYVAADPRVVNPSGLVADQDTDADHWENLSQLYELKSFTPDGKGILAVGLPNNNVDVVRIDLATGRTTRLTADPDWDEDGSLSPDQRSFVVNSWRGQHRLDLLAWIPQVRGFVGLMTGAAIAPYYVSTWDGFQCDLSPWLLSAAGDDGGRAIGQPLDVYGGARTAGNNVQGQQVWSPDSTMVLLQDRSRVRDQFAPNRIALARLDRAPTKPVRIEPTNVGAWAPPATAYRGPLAGDRDIVVSGRSGGRATIRYRGRLAGGGASIAVAYDRFTDDGVTYVDGTMSGASANQGSGEKMVWRLLADLTVTGRHSGKLTMDLTIDNAARPLPVMTGSASAVYDGRQAPPLPALGACYDHQPRPFPLRLSATLGSRGVLATVTADIHGDIRPVRNAVVTVDGQNRRTDANGKVSIPTARRKGQLALSARAGDTFVPATATVDLP